MVREPIFEETWNATRVGKFARIRPVMTSTDGRWGGEDQVDAGGAGLLREAGQSVPSGSSCRRPSSGRRVRR